MRTQLTLCAQILLRFKNSDEMRDWVGAMKRFAESQPDRNIRLLENAQSFEAAAASAVTKNDEEVRLQLTLLSVCVCGLCIVSDPLTGAVVRPKRGQRRRAVGVRRRGLGCFPGDQGRDAHPEPRR